MNVLYKVRTIGKLLKFAIALKPFLVGYMDDFVAKVPKDGVFEDTAAGANDGIVEKVIRSVDFDDSGRVNEDIERKRAKSGFVSMLESQLVQEPGYFPVRSTRLFNGGRNSGESVD